ncbi:MAG: hypothetical protein K0Q79_412 [Flavipsychrobacter sp.]|jgi:hypothetical protein|nr:hypothetical protein [Flavipsychrobacter sp.]
MKHTLLFLLFTVLVASSYAQPGSGRHNGGGGGRGDGRGSVYRDDQSTLSIFSEKGEQFFVVLNGINQNNAPAYKVRIEGLPQYGNDVEIIFADNRTAAIRRRITIADPVDGKAVHMTLKIERNRSGLPSLRFHKCIEVEDNYRAPDDEYCMTYGQPRRTYVRETNTPPPSRGPRAMDRATFNDAKQTIENASFDNTKLSTAKTILDANYVTTDQVIELCKLFSFENSMLDFAKFAYSRTVDNNNYFKVGNVFSFDASRKSLNDYISRGGR